ncbi:L-ascorbate oxidase-like protein [Hordeum vulgare]|nr:L-ascorbate oxidase-like protein [Hordeum vulgare]
MKGVWLHVLDCHNGAVYADADYPAPGVTLLRHGWKTFTRAHNFMAGHVLCFKLVEADMLSSNIYGLSGARLGCSEESSSDPGSSSSSNSDEEDSADRDGDSVINNESPSVKSEYDGSGSS